MLQALLLYRSARLSRNYIAEQILDFAKLEDGKPLEPITPILEDSNLSVNSSIASRPRQLIDSPRSGGSERSIRLELPPPPQWR